MKVNTERTSKAVDAEKMKVSSSWRGEISISFGDDMFFFSPKDTVEIWRVMKGEKDACDVVYATHRLVENTRTLRVRYEEGDEEYRWGLEFSDDFRVVLDANEALALSWAIERQVSNDICGGRESGRANEACGHPKDVWVLSCKIILTGDCFVSDESERIGGGERVFLSEESAYDAARDYIRDLVNESYSESYWENSDRNVDDLIDEIMSGPKKVGYWTHDGQKQSFEVTICKRTVEE